MAVADPGLSPWSTGQCRCDYELSVALLFSMGLLYTAGSLSRGTEMESPFNTNSGEIKHGLGEGSSRVHRVPRIQTLEICSVFPSEFSRKHLTWDWLPEAGYLEWRLEQERQRGSGVGREGDSG